MVVGWVIFSLFQFIKVTKNGSGYESPGLTENWKPQIQCSLELQDLK